MKMKKIYLWALSASAACLFLLVSSLIMLSGCDRYYENRHRKYAEETKCLGELKITYFRILSSEELKETNSIKNICKILKNEGHISFFDSYGHENIFFDTNIYLYINYSKRSYEENSRDKDMKRLAVALRMKSDKYLGIRFDGTWCKTNALSSELHNILIDEE